MVTAPVLARSLDVQLPQYRPDTPKPAPQLHLRVDAAGGYWLEGEAVDRNALDAALRAAVARDADLQRLVCARRRRRLPGVSSPPCRRRAPPASTPSQRRADASGVREDAQVARTVASSPAYSASSTSACPIETSATPRPPRGRRRGWSLAEVVGRRSRPVRRVPRAARCRRQAASAGRRRRWQNAAANGPV